MLLYEARKSWNTELLLFYLFVYLFIGTTYVFSKEAILYNRKQNVLYGQESKKQNLACE